MPHAINPELKSRLDRTRNQLVAWRQANTAPKPIPAEIWGTAVELSQQLGLTRVARELKLDYGTLKRRAKQQPAPAPSFVEFLGPVFSERIESCVLQMQSPRCQATLQLQQVSPKALGGILREVLL